MNMKEVFGTIFQLKKIILLVVCIVCFSAGLYWGSSHERKPATDLSTSSPAFVSGAKLYSNIYFNASAEYRACCLEIYKMATLRLQTLVKERKKGSQPLAVIMDLDETVLDNSPFQAFLVRNKITYSDSLWMLYERQYSQDILLVPGAKDFILTAKQLGVKVCFISTRTEENRKFTVAAMNRLGIGGEDLEERLFLRKQSEPSDKTVRRTSIEQTNTVLLYIGDSLRDFSEFFVARTLSKNAPVKDYLHAIDLRNTQVDFAHDHWATNWFILPNPIYGEWEKLIPADPTAILHHTSMVSNAK